MNFPQDNPESLALDQLTDGMEAICNLIGEKFNFSALVIGLIEGENRLEYPTGKEEFGVRMAPYFYVKSSAHMVVLLSTLVDQTGRHAKLNGDYKIAQVCEELGTILRDKFKELGFRQESTSTVKAN